MVAGDRRRFVACISVRIELSTGMYWGILEMVEGQFLDS